MSRLVAGDDPFEKRDVDEKDIADQYGNVKRSAIDLVVSTKSGVTYSNDQGEGL
jgi:hypothetical protein